MKKILTLFVMLLCGWSIVSAQAPVFGYQAVVRTPDNKLVVNTPVTVTVDVRYAGDVLYSEEQTGLSTDDLGMLSILVGTGTISQSPNLATRLDSIDWTMADNILTTITVDGGSAIAVETPIYAAPYALQAASTQLTTEQIVAYLSDTATTIEDYKEIMDSLVNNAESNGQLWQIIKNRLAQYLKDHRDKAVEVACYYLANANANDVLPLIDTLMDKPEVVAKVVELAKQYALANKTYAVAVLENYMSQLSVEEVDEIKAALLTHETELIPYVVDYAIAQRTFVLNVMASFFGEVSGSDVSATLSRFNQSQMKQELINHLFFTYLDSKIGGTSGMGQTQIVNQVQTTMDNNGYLQKAQCNGQDVNICDIWETVEQ